jgi:hypothetical protein
MAIGRPRAIDAAPARRPERSGGWRPGHFLVSRGMGVAQGKKVDRRHCGIGDRGEAGLRPDQPIKEAAWSARSGREDQGEPGGSVVQPQGSGDVGGQCFTMSRQTTPRINAPDEKRSGERSGRCLLADVDVRCAAWRAFQRNQRSTGSVRPKAFQEHNELPTDAVESTATA